MKHYFELDLYDTIDDYIGHVTILADSANEALSKGQTIVMEMPTLFKKTIKPSMFICDIH